jgi:hypothetical protein
LLVALDVSIGFVPDEVGRVELFYEVWVVLVHYLPRTLRVGLVLFRHNRGLLSPLLPSVLEPYPRAGEAKTKKWSKVRAKGDKHKRGREAL